jgi:hypothetical protein
MATTHLTWFGVVVEFSDPEITQIINAVNTAGATAATIAAILAATGVTRPAAAIAAIVAAILGPGGARLTTCNGPPQGNRSYSVLGRFALVQK